MRKIGKIDVICGPMFSGKTSELLRRLERLDFAKKKYVLFKPKFDNRYSETSVVSHSKKEHHSICVHNPKEIINFLNKEENKNIYYIAIDEAQFFSRDDRYTIVDLCLELKKRYIKVIINGLDMDCSGAPFGMMPELMAMADNIMKLTAVCVYRGCGEKATMSYKKEKIKKYNKEENHVELGESDLYEARCFKHWLIKD